MHRTRPLPGPADLIRSLTVHRITTAAACPITDLLQHRDRPDPPHHPIKENTVMTVLADAVDVVIGVDPHKHTHTAAAVAADTGKHHASRTCSADPDGFTELLDFASGHEGSRCWVI